MIRQSVRSDNGDREGKWVVLCIGLILLVSFVLLPYHQTTQPQSILLSHQIAITDLAAEEIAMVAELRLAHEEIRNLFQDSQLSDAVGQWPKISELQEFWIAPFVTDKSWERKGRHQWALITGAIYQGVKTDEKGAMSVVLNSVSASPDIWLAMNNDVVLLDANTLHDFDETQLISNGWTQIVFNDSPKNNEPHNH
ncbi:MULTISPECIES: hypothetical protein [unclassified Photobacterium]|uniref:DUF6162 family protein n=1 Tax=unclassified Photobacterium TaxID=2628852 RepID=UPI001EDD31CC|nr:MULTISPECIES: hypothetical protein [unclassified Photobacterium]MCG3865218.1 hypothetical protein [Photobacterium sp. Ph6]MCG3876749.1 hypothetical protein [Photobacterium sp. Ph5]